MLKLFIQGRKTGKTTKVLGLLESDPNAMLIIPMNGMKQHFKEMSVGNRIFTFDEIIRGKVDLIDLERFTKAVIDEGFMANKEDLAKLYYMLGKLNIDTIVYGTIEG